MRRLFIVVLLLTSSCDKKATVGSTTGDETRISEIQALVQDILDLPKLQWIYHPEVQERLPVKLMESGLVTKDLRLTKFEREVVIMTKEELEKSKILHYVNLEELSFKGDTLVFHLTYKAEGAFADGKYVKDGDKWRVLNYTVGEY